MLMGFFFFLMLLSALFDAFTLLVALSVFYYILTIIGAWKVFCKMGEKGWKSLIPFYNDYVIYKNIWRSSWYFVFLIISIVIGLLESRTADAYVGLASIILSVFAIAIEFKAMISMSRSFGHGIPYALGLYFFRPVFMVILGFNNDSFGHDVRYREVSK